MQTELFFNLLNNQHLFSSETASELKHLTEKYPWFQLGWMLYLKNLKQTDSPEYTSVLKEVAVRMPDRKLLYSFMNAETQKKHDKTENTSSNNVLDELEVDFENNISNSLIDNFLSSDTGSLRRNPDEVTNSENENRTDVIEKSDAESDELITETLAAIYFQQKNYEKASSAYKKLSLKYPEKSIYFAAQIEDIEKLKNNNS